MTLAMPLRLIFITVVLLPNLGFSQDSFRTVGELIAKVITEREKLMEYAVDVRVRGRLPSTELAFQKRLTTDSTTELRIEYSRLSNHYLTSACFEPKKNSRIWFTTGFSGKFAVEGQSNSQIVMNSKHFVKLDRKNTELKVFDPRAVGLLDSKQIADGNRYEFIASAISHAEEGSKVYKLRGKWVAEWPKSGLKLVFDPERSYWPTTMTLSPEGASFEEHWRIETKDHFGTFVPVHAEFEVIQLDVRGRKKSSELVTFDFDWEVVNQFIQGGIAAGSRLSQMHNIPLIVESY